MSSNNMGYPEQKGHALGYPGPLVLLRVIGSDPPLALMSLDGCPLAPAATLASGGQDAGSGCDARGVYCPRPSYESSNCNG